MLTSRSSISVSILTLMVSIALVQRAGAEETATLEGKITLDGKPLGGWKIILHIGNGQFVGSKVKEDGSFKVDRVPVGKHIVTLEAPIKDRKLLSPKYAAEEQSPLVTTVNKGGE